MRAFVSSTVGYAAAELGQVWETTDGGSTWTEILNRGYPYYYYGIAVSGKNVVASGFDDSNSEAILTPSTNGGGGNIYSSVGGIYYSADGGRTWSEDLSTEDEIGACASQNLGNGETQIWCIGDAENNGNFSSNVYSTTVTTPK